MLNTIPASELGITTNFAAIGFVVPIPTFPDVVIVNFSVGAEVEFSEVTLHIGLGTFRPVEVEDLTKHKMASEQMSIEQKDADKVNDAKRNRKRVIAVGTTSMRAIET